MKGKQSLKNEIDMGSSQLFQELKKMNAKLAKEQREPGQVIVYVRGKKLRVSRIDRLAPQVD